MPTVATVAWCAAASTADSGFIGGGCSAAQDARTCDAVAADARKPSANAALPTAPPPGAGGCGCGERGRTPKSKLCAESPVTMMEDASERFRELRSDELSIRELLLCASVMELPLAEAMVASSRALEARAEASLIAEPGRVPPCLEPGRGDSSVAALLPTDGPSALEPLLGKDARSDRATAPPALLKDARSAAPLGLADRRRAAWASRLGAGCTMDAVPGRLAGRGSNRGAPAPPSLAPSLASARA